MQSFGFSVGDVQCTWKNEVEANERCFRAAMLEKMYDFPFSGKKIIQFPTSVHKK